MTNEQLDALEAAAKAATPGPWGYDEADEDMAVLGAESQLVKDAAYIAAANPSAILSLIAELRQVKQRCAQLTKERIYLAKCLEYNNGPDMRVSAYEYIARAKEATRND